MEFLAIFFLMGAVCAFKEHRPENVDQIKEEQLDCRFSGPRRASEDITKFEVDRVKAARWDRMVLRLCCHWVGRATLHRSDRWMLRTVGW